MTQIGRHRIKFYKLTGFSFRCSSSGHVNARLHIRAEGRDHGGDMRQDSAGGNVVAYPQDRGHAVQDADVPMDAGG